MAGGNLMESAINGDSTAFGLLLDQLWEPAYRLAFSMLRDREAAEDSVQEAALKAWRSVRKLRADTLSLRPWFITIVANQCRSTRRSRWWRVMRFADVPEQEDRSVGGIEQRLDLSRALRTLSEEHRLVLALRYFVDLPVDEVAQVLGISVPATKSRILRALKALRPALDSGGTTW
jgi:RNA polymerase sigma-70 factor (ECF subfamily)